ncbi:12051_t:CDS:2, partial [Racocetra persica]
MYPSTKETYEVYDDGNNSVRKKSCKKISTDEVRKNKVKEEQQRRKQI